MKKCNLSDTLITCITFTSYIPHCCSATCVLTIWSVISILNSVLGMQLEMLSDAPAFTAGILPHTQRLDLTCCFNGMTGVTNLSGSDSGPHSLCCFMLPLSYIWTDQSCVFLFVCFLIMLACQFWEACQAAGSTNAFSLGDKTEMTRQSPFCQHCHGSTGTTVYPKVNGMTECQTGRKVRLFYLKWIDRRHWHHVTHRCESTKSQISKWYVNSYLQSIHPFIFWCLFQIKITGVLVLIAAATGGEAGIHCGQVGSPSLDTHIIHTRVHNKRQLGVSNQPAVHVFRL